MKKIPTMFKRVFDGHKIVETLPEFESELCKTALEIGTPTVKFDGSPILVRNGRVYKRLDVGKAKNWPVDIPIILCEKKVDEITGHWPAWIELQKDAPADQWFLEAYSNYWKDFEVKNGTYEAIGPHFQGNPYNLIVDTLTPHGARRIIGLERTFEGVKEWLETRHHEGIVFWYHDRPVCKIKRTDFGFPWPVK